MPQIPRVYLDDLKGFMREVTIESPGGYARSTDAEQLMKKAEEVMHDLDVQLKEIMGGMSADLESIPVDSPEYFYALDYYYEKLKGVNATVTIQIEAATWSEKKDRVIGVKDLWRLRNVIHEIKRNHIEQDKLSIDMSLSYAKQHKVTSVKPGSLATVTTSSTESLKWDSASGYVLMQTTQLGIYAVKKIDAGYQIEASGQHFFIPNNFNNPQVADQGRWVDVTQRNAVLDFFYGHQDEIAAMLKQNMAGSSITSLTVATSTLWQQPDPHNPAVLDREIRLSTPISLGKYEAHAENLAVSVVPRFDGLELIGLAGGRGDQRRTVILYSDGTCTAEYYNRDAGKVMKQERVKPSDLISPVAWELANKAADIVKAAGLQLPSGHAPGMTP